MQLGRIGVWIGAFTVAPASDARPAVREIEALGYDTLWYPEGLGTRESFTNGAVLLAATDRIRIASGIANIWARDAVSAANAARVLSDAFDDRYLNAGILRTASWPFTVALIALSVTLVGMLACVKPTLRAIRIRPMEALRG